MMARFSTANCTFTAETPSDPELDYEALPGEAKIQLMVYDIPMCAGEEKLWDERKKDLERLVPGNAWARPILVRRTSCEVSRWK